jgi:hypothetical protein
MEKEENGSDEDESGKSMIGDRQKEKYEGMKMLKYLHHVNMKMNEGVFRYIHTYSHTFKYSHTLF